MREGEQRRICVSSSFESVRVLADFTREAVSGLFPENELTNVELAIVEAANNIVEHAYKNSKGWPVEFSVDCLSDSVIFCFNDLGLPFDPATVPIPSFDFDNLDSIAEGGRGLFIINSIMDEIRYYSVEGKNYTVLKKKFAVRLPRPEHYHDFINRDGLLVGQDPLALSIFEETASLMNFAAGFSADSGKKAFLSGMLERISDIFKAEWGTLRFEEKGALVLISAIGICPENNCQQRINLRRQTGIEISAFLAGEPRMGVDSSEGTSSSVLVIPISWSENLKGSIMLGHNSGSFSESHLKKAMQLYRFIGLLIDNRILTGKISSSEESMRQMEMAANMHKELVETMLPELPGLSLFARSKSALETGGDYLAFHKQSDSVLWFMVCDAMGKGITASIFSTLAHMTFKSILFLKENVSPGELLSLANRIMSKDFDRFEMFMTALLGRIDLAQGTIEYASAGHCPPILYRPGSAVELMDTQDFMMGVDVDTEYRTFKAPFTRGMKLLTYTDGITDIVGPSGEPAGVEPLLYACEAEFKRKNIVDACSKIFAEALIVSGNPPQDDISMLGIEYIGKK